jgi:hypothetical protein
MNILKSKTGNGATSITLLQTIHHLLFLVPVIAVITKCEALETKAVDDLMSAGVEEEEAWERAPEEAKKILKAQFIDRIIEANHHADQIAQLEGERSAYFAHVLD